LQRAPRHRRSPQNNISDSARLEFEKHFFDIKSRSFFIYPTHEADGILLLIVLKASVYQTGKRIVPFFAEDQARYL